MRGLATRTSGGCGWNREEREEKGSINEGRKQLPMGVAMTNIAEIDERG